MTLYLNSGDCNLSLIARGAVTTEDEAQSTKAMGSAKRGIAKFAICSITAVAVGVILALVLTNPVLLAVGLGIAFAVGAVSTAFLVRSIVRYRKAQSKHQTSLKEVKKIYEEVIHAIDERRTEKISSVITQIRNQAQNPDAMAEFHSMAFARNEIQSIITAYDLPYAGNTLFQDAKTVYAQTVQRPIPQKTQEKLTAALNQITETSGKRTRLQVRFDEEIKSFAPEPVKDSEGEGLLIENSETTGHAKYDGDLEKLAKFLDSEGYAKAYKTSFSGLLQQVQNIDEVKPEEVESLAYIIKRLKELIPPPSTEKSTTPLRETEQKKEDPEMKRCLEAVAAQGGNGAFGQRTGARRNLGESSGKQKDRSCNPADFDERNKKTKKNEAVSLLRMADII